LIPKAALARAPWPRRQPARTVVGSTHGAIKKAIMALCRCQASLAAPDACNVTRASIAVIAVSGESHAPPTVAAFNAGEFGK
jgi:hypothetical protein